LALRDKVISGVIWSAIERISVQVVRFGITIILARLLSPGDYGLLGMLAIFIALSNVFIDSGLGQALIQKKDADNIDYSTIFYYNIALAILFYIILFFSAPYIAEFYKQPLLKDLSRVVFLNLIFSSLSLIQNTIVSKEMNFKVYTKVSIISYIASGSISIGMAYRGYGVWSLVFQTLCNSLFQTILLWIFNTWRPLFIFSIKSFKKLFAKSSSLLATGIVSQIFDNIYYVIIGKFYSNINLGFYTQAKRLQEMPLMTLNGVIQAVTFPALVQIQDDNERLKMNYSKIIQIFMFINVPLMAGLMVCARPLVISVLTGIFFPFGLINGNTMKVKGRFKLMFQVDLIKKAVLIILLLISFSFGLYAIVLGQAVYIIFGIIINIYFGSRLISFSFSEQIKSVLPYLLVCVISIIPALFLLLLTQWNPLIILISQIITISGLYLLFSKLFNLYAYNEIVLIIKDKLLQRRNNNKVIR
jgi:teichuronic acid exporter